MERKIRYSLIIACLIMSQIGKGQHMVVGEQLKKKTTELEKRMNVLASDALDPLALNIETVWSDDRTQFAVVIKAMVLPTWHIYARVPRGQPFIETKILSSSSKNIVPIGNWERSSAYPYGNEGIFVYEDEFVFKRYYSLKDKLTANDSLKCGLYYQACNPYQCLPPKEKQKSIVFKK